MKRRNTVLVAALALIVGLVAYGTAAYFSGEAHVTNVITTGTIDITLNEYTTDEEGNRVAWPSKGIQGVMPGQSVDKLVSVKNEGTGQAWVRVKVDTAIELAGGAGEVSGKDLLSFDIQPGWVDGGDGYYYYSQPLSADQTTPELFTAVTFSTDMGNSYQGCTVNVTVYAQAVQVKNNPAPDGDVTQVVGWPART